MNIDLKGTPGLVGTATAQVLTGLPDDQNSIENPRKVAPVTTTLNNFSPNFSPTFPAYSVTVIRFNARKYSPSSSIGYTP